MFTRLGRRLAKLLLLLVAITALLRCTPASRPGLPPSSPFAESTAETGPPLKHGVATGDVTSRSALVWFRTDGASRAQVVWAPETDSAQAGDLRRSPAVTTTADHDFTISVPLQGLEPATPYRYQVLAGTASGQTALQARATGRFKTAASPDAPEQLTLVWSGDLGGQGLCRGPGTGYAIFDRILKEAPTFAILLGDLMYSDDRCPSPPNVTGSDFMATTLDHYRAKHRYQREDASLQRFLATVPVYAMWDDHEVKNNFAGRHEPLMPIGRRALREYWPIGVMPEDPHRLYRRVRRGADLELFMLDTRQYRDSNAEPDRPGKTMLGDEQRRWLLDGLMASQATWKIIATSVPLSNVKPGNAQMPGNDSWALGPDGTGFQSELRMILNTILERRIKNVIWVATDVHFSQVNAYDPDGNGVPDFHEFICGPLSARAGAPTPPDATFGPNVLYEAGGFSNFGKILINGTTLRLQIIDEAGEVRFDRRFAAS